MTDLRKAAEAALEALEQLQCGCTDSNDGTVEAITVWCPEVIDVLRAALAEPVQPVAWLYRGEPWYDGSLWHDRWEVTTDERVAKFKDKDASPLYATAPQPREPVRLTDEQVLANDDIMECTAQIGAGMAELMRLVRAVEAAVLRSQGPSTAARITG